MESAYALYHKAFEQEPGNLRYKTAYERVRLVAAMIHVGRGERLAAAVDVQQPARQRPPLAPPAVHAPFTRLGHQPCALQHQLYPCVALLKAVLLAQLFIEMPHVPIEITLPGKAP
jgi:hypothetical protein